MSVCLSTKHVCVTCLLSLVKQIKENAEISNLKQILGLKHSESYENGVSSLRYGKLMIMTDQDHDGSHIKGLIINFLHHSWPKLVQKHDFVTEFITPIVKAKKGTREIAFYTLPEYKQWREQNNDGRGWHIKYYKVCVFACVCSACACMFV